MSSTLKWNASDTSIDFTVERSDVPIHPDQWAIDSDLLTQDGHVARVGHLLHLLAEDRASLSGTHAVTVGNDVVADLSRAALAGLGLPEPFSFAIEVSSQGLLTDPGFKVTLRFVHADGRPVMAVNRSGAVLSIGQRRYTLSNPAYRIAESVDSLTEAKDVEARLVALAALQEALPVESVVGSYLRQTRVVLADAFTLRPFRAPDGTVDFDPRPLRRTTPIDLLEPEDGDRTNESSELLPPAREQEWARHLRTLTSRATLPAGGGWYVTTTPELRRALEVVKGKQLAPAAEREAFARNPRVYLKEAIGPGAEESVEQLFAETGGYGQRVREIGVWRAKVLPITRAPGGCWLPTELMGLRIGDVETTVAPERRQQLLDDMLEAQAVGEPNVEFDGHKVPVTPESIAAVRRLISDSDTAGSEQPEPNTNDRITVQIADNIEEATFSRPRRQTKMGVGELPTTLSSTLFPFQYAGYRWLQEHWVSGASGAVLADDMGLGKTLQTLSFVAWVRQQPHSDRRPNLVIGPTGLLRNWQAEHDRHLRQPGLGRLVEAHGSGLAALKLLEGVRGTEIRTGFPSLDIGSLRQADWVLTTYETLRDYQHSFAQVPWRVVVFDEAQRIKNPSVMTTDAAKSLEAEFTVALTGTPVENHIADLWSIADAVQPGYLGSLRDFVRDYPNCDSSKLETLRLRVQVENPPPLMLRRLKKDHLDGLPPIEVHVERITMPDVQARRYEQVVARALKSTHREGVLEALQNLRSVSLHPDSEQSSTDAEFISASARLRRTVEILDDVASRCEKALIFVEALAMQAVLVEILQRRYRLRHAPIVINGELAGARRKERVDAFQERAGFDVMLLSPRAGGVGLTITAANHVIHLSRWWNPAVEDQATDRVYRIGQQRPVHVYLPLAMHPLYGESSFDHKLNELLTRKRNLSAGILAPSPATVADLQDLFRSTVEAHKVE